MTKHFRKAVFVPFHELFQSRDFWYGFLDGFAPQKFLLTSCEAQQLRARRDSVYDAWMDVGDLLTMTIDEANNVASNTSVWVAERAESKRANAH